MDKIGRKVKHTDWHTTPNYNLNKLILISTKLN